MGNEEEKKELLLGILDIILFELVHPRCSWDQDNNSYDRLST